MRSKLTTRKALVVIIGVMFALAWAIPSLGASAGKVARTALGRANEAFYKSNVAVNSSDTAKNTANSANATAGAANTSANQAKTAASQAQSTANSALSAATAADEVQDNFTKTYDLGNLSASGCTSDTFSRLGVVTTDAVVVTPADNQPNGI
ncbi:MAG: hypothetical protein ACJ75Z_00670, partial [Solirubrobacterales bacterium]